MYVYMIVYIYIYIFMYIYIYIYTYQAPRAPRALRGLPDMATTTTDIISTNMQTNNDTMNNTTQ